MPNGVILATSAPNGSFTRVDYDGTDPNGVLTAVAGSMAIGPSGTWVNVDGGTTWVRTDLQRSVVTITPDQIRSLRATPQQLVPAPPAGFIEFVSAHFFLDFGTVPFNLPTAAGDDLAVRYSNASGSQVAVQEADNLINASADIHFLLYGGILAAGNNTIQVVGPAPLVLHNKGNNEYTGAGDSLLKVETTYRIRALEPR